MGRRVLLFCFPMSHKKDARLIWVNVSDQIKEVGETAHIWLPCLQCSLCIFLVTLSVIYIGVAETLRGMLIASGVHFFFFFTVTCL